MKPLLFALALALAGTSAMAAEVESHGPHPFNIRDLVMMDRVGDPQLSPDGRYALYTVRATDYAANKGVTAIYLLDLEKNAAPVKLVDKASSPRWAPDGSAFYYVAPNDGVAQLWRHPLGKATDAKAVQVTHVPIDVDGYKLSPDGKKALLTLGVFTDCADLACTQGAFGRPCRRQGVGHGLRQVVRASLGYLGRRPSRAVVHHRPGQTPTSSRCC